jgi:hypothetical protein
MKRKDMTVHAEAARIYEKRYRSYNPFELVKHFLAVFFAGQSTIESPTMRRLKR